MTVENNIVKPLYKHLIHTTFPTMAFIGIPFQIVPFPLFDVQVCLLNSLSWVVLLGELLVAVAVVVIMVTVAVMVMDVMEVIVIVKVECLKLIECY